MITFKNITNAEYKDTLQHMIKDHYRELYGENWEVKNFFQRMKDSRSFSTFRTERDMSELFKKSIYGTVAYGIFKDEDLIGFVLLDVLNSTNKKLEVETYGQMYQLYIKPEYRFQGKDQELFISVLNNYLDEYFLKHGVNEVLTELPDDIKYLIECGKALGFSQVKESKNASGISTSLWQKKI